MDLIRINARLVVRSQISTRLAVHKPGAPLCRISHRAFGAQTSLRATTVAKKSRDAASQSKGARKSAASSDGPDLTLNFVKAGAPEGAYHPVFLRDACRCPLCVDPSSTQKNFSTADIPSDIEAKSVKTKENGEVEVQWTKDVPGFASEHISTYPQKFFDGLASLGARKNVHADNFNVRLWDSKIINAELKAFSYNEFMTEDEPLFRAFLALESHGILLVRGVPDSENAVEDLAGRIGAIRETFYGRTWDVKYDVGAKNVAYTNKELGLHMDLLYMKDPPAFQLLHCLKNTAEGGESRFADAFNVVSKFPAKITDFLGPLKLAFQYKNAGENYYHEHPLFEFRYGEKMTVKNESRTAISAVNWSPPFQAELPFTVQKQVPLLQSFLELMRNFSGLAEKEYMSFNYKLKQGEAVIFNNRRILHGRTAFEPKAGERLLKGTYVDGDAYKSKLRNIFEKFRGSTIRAKDNDGRFINPEAYAQKLAHDSKKAAQ